MKGSSNTKGGEDSSDGLRSAFDVWYGGRDGDSGGLWGDSDCVKCGNGNG